MYMPLKRKQIYIDPQSESRIRKLAKATGLSEAEHIRRAIASYVDAIPDLKEGEHPLLTMIGICDSETGPKDAAVNHDSYLYGENQ
jgi:hypothetical protein